VGAWVNLPVQPPLITVLKPTLVTTLDTTAETTPDTAGNATFKTPYVRS